MQGCPAGNNRVDSRRFGLLPAAALAILTVMWPGGVADAQQAVISSAGPMTQIVLSDDLGCQVQMANDTSPAFYTLSPLSTGTDPGACGTFLQIASPSGAGQLFGPTVPSGDAAGTAPFTLGTQSPVTGNGTAASPYSVTTTVDACTGSRCSLPNGSLVATLTEIDTYVAGDDFYSTSLTIRDVSDVPLKGTLYHAGDCFLQSSDSGYGALGAGGAPECALSSNNSPAGRILSFVPGSLPSPPSAYFEGAWDTFWTDIATTGLPYPDTIDATLQDNGLGLSWAYSLQSSNSETTQYTTLVSVPPANTASPVVSGSPAAGQTLTCLPGSWSPSGPITYTYQWLQNGNLIAGATNSTYTVQIGDTAQSLSCQVTANTDGGSATATSAAVTVTNVPAVSPQPPTLNGTQGATFTAGVNPNGSNTTVHFEYGLDPKYGLTTASNPYVERTADQSVASGFSPQVVIAGVTGLVPNALYHVRIVATNSIGTVTGADQAFKTAALPPPPAPVLGREANFTPTSGIVYIKAPPGAHIAGLHADVTGHAAAAVPRGHGFIPLTEALQLPIGSEVDARNGKLKVTTATTAGGKSKRTKTQSGEFSQGLFEVLQSGKRSLKGLTVLKLLDSGIFPGAPSYKTECAVAGKASAQVGEKGKLVVFKPRRLSHRALQTLLAGEQGSYQTQGRYSAATVRGTTFSVTDRCDGTLTHVQRGTVVVDDFRQHRNITVHTGHEYLAKAP